MINGIPAAHQPTSVYRYYDGPILLYIGITKDLLERNEQHARDKSWYRYATHMTIEHYPSRQAALDAEAEAIQNEEPVFNISGASDWQKRQLGYTRDHSTRTTSEGGLITISCDDCDWTAYTGDWRTAARWAQAHELKQ